MGEEAERFRRRAKECRELANIARASADRKTLDNMADDLEAEANTIDTEEVKRTQGTESDC